MSKQKKVRGEQRKKKAVPAPDGAGNYFSKKKKSSISDFI